MKKSTAKNEPFPSADAPDSPPAPRTGGFVVLVTLLSLIGAGVVTTIAYNFDAPAAVRLAELVGLDGGYDEYTDVEELERQLEAEIRRQIDREIGKYAKDASREQMREEIVRRLQHEIDVAKFVEDGGKPPAGGKPAARGSTEFDKLLKLYRETERARQNTEAWEAQNPRDRVVRVYFYPDRSNDPNDIMVAGLMTERAEAVSWIEVANRPSKAHVTVSVDATSLYSNNLRHGVWRLGCAYDVEVRRNGRRVFREDYSQRVVLERSDVKVPIGQAIEMMFIDKEFIRALKATAVK